MNKIILASFIAACGLGAFADTAIAQNASADVSTTTTTTQQTAANADVNVALGTRQVPAPGDRGCLRDTGSHIRPPKGGCLPVNGDSYSREELLQTGDPNLGRALRQLDPRVSSGGG
ncbi:MAG: hypothetical protein ABIY40_03575 [Rhodanobacteraceae bacterium]